MDIFKELVAWAKANAKDGVNVAEFEELVSKAAPPDDAKQATEYIRAIPSLRSAFDAALNREFDRAIEKYEKEKLPEKEKALRESIRKELNPDETEEQKRTRLVIEENIQLKAENERRERVEKLRPRLKEIGLDPEFAEDYVVYGDKAIEKAEKAAAWHKKELDAIKAETARGAFGNKAPKTGSPVKKAIKDMTPDEAMQYAKLGDAERAEVLAAFKK